MQLLADLRDANVGCLGAEKAGAEELFRTISVEVEIEDSKRDMNRIFSE